MNMNEITDWLSSATGNFTSFDWVVLAIVAISMLVGLWRGFAREAMSLLGWALAFIAANLLARPLSEALSPIIENPTFSYLVGWLLIFAAVLAIFGAIGSWLSKQMKQPGFNLGNRILGGVFGVLRGMVVVMAVTLILKAILPDGRQDWLEDAELTPTIDAMADWFSDNFDDVLEAKPTQQLEETIESGEML